MSVTASRSLIQSERHRRRSPSHPPLPVKPGANTCRVTPLTKLPRNIHITFVSGEGDEFIKRPYQALKGIPALSEVANSMDASSTVVGVEGGKHNCLAVGKKRAVSFWG